ncbi:hypothetical protein PIROE2DRAFT_1600 [Piromyces sp. E2]|nr:hypothetical protein PIROE2DRAFT_1600 [Piromyces sp. E2]|eukprot:OUM70199.1 hypothetical protein PIROE2DRAFT_1600 [Piromyces sp. E2]
MEVKIVYRCTINNIPTHETKIQDALSKGVEILCLRTIASVIPGFKNLVSRMEKKNNLLIFSERMNEKDKAEKNALITRVDFIENTAKTFYRKESNAMLPNDSV